MAVIHGCVGDALLKRHVTRFPSIAFLVSHSETYSGNRTPLLFYAAHERNRKEVGVF